MPRELLLANKKLENMYRIIDREGVKSVTADKLYSVFGLGGEVDINEWTTMVKKFDKMERGAIGYDEFKAIIDKVFE